MARSLSSLPPPARRFDWPRLVAVLAVLVVVGFLALYHYVLTAPIGSLFNHGYSVTQMMQAADRIGAPPGFTEVDSTSGGGGFERLPGVQITYTGSDSTDHLVTWSVNRLRSFGLFPKSGQPGQTGVEMVADGAEVGTFCPGLAITLDLNDTYIQGGQFAVTVDGIEGPGPSCPSSLVG
jgi:hypothetical protein